MKKYFQYFVKVLKTMYQMCYIESKNRYYYWAKRFARKLEEIMSDLNDLKLFGRIVKDAIIKQKNEKQIAYFTLAVNKTKKDADGNYFSEANYFPISVFVKNENILSRLKKGQPLLLEGSLKQETQEIGKSEDGKIIYDSRIYINTKQIHFMPTGKKENIVGEDFSEDFIMDNVYQANDIYVEDMD